MPLTVLFDLDETLLSTHMDQFIPVYFDLLSQSLSHLGAHKKVTAQIQHAVHMMFANQDPGKTLKEVFAENFYPQLGTTENACQPILDAYYKNEYPKLKPITQAKPAASKLVKWCLSEGIMMAVATNPLFPQTATRQRIEWAGLDPDDFAFFTSYNDFHFTKPHLAYYAEVLGRLGWPQGSLVMIGDNLSDDLFPMDTIGANTFWINDGHQAVLWEGGTLSDVKPWLKQVIQKIGQWLASSPEINIAILRSTPAVIDTWLRVKPKEATQINKQPQEKQILEMLSSLISLEEAIYPPLWEQIINGSSFEPPVLPTHTNKGKNEDDHQNPLEIFHRFIKARQVFLEQIDEFYRVGRVEHGVNKMQAMNKLVNWMADQDRNLLHHALNL